MRLPAPFACFLLAVAARALVASGVALPSRDGWRVMQLIATSGQKPANFETLRGVVLQDWTDATMADHRTAAVRELEKKYLVRYEAPAK